MYELEKSLGGSMQYKEHRGKKSGRRTMKKLVYKSNVQRAALERNAENTVAKS